MTAEQTYTGSSIEVLEGLQAVRKRPGMYIGSTDKNGLHHLVYEIFDNSVDEVINGHGDTIEVTILKGNGIRVKDYGRGMPVDKHKTGKSTPEVLFTVLHAGGKFGQGGYKTTGGLHGVGASVVNALSTSLTAVIQRDGKVHEIKFENGGNTVQELTVVGKCKKGETGTEVTFYPDPNIFSVTKYSYDTLAERLKETAFLNKNVRIVLRDERKSDVREEEFLFTGGIADFVAYLNSDKTVISPVEYEEGSLAEGVEVEVGYQWNDTYSENILSYVNNVRTRDGGTHETGFKTALTKAVNEVGRERDLIKKRDKNLEGGDIREGFTGVISVKVPEEILEFEGQTKSKLGTNVVRSVVENFVMERVKRFLHENPKVTEAMVKKALNAQKVREDAKKARDTARKTQKKQGNTLLGKLTDARSKKRELCELYLVEGDSAGGTAKQARDKKTQAILPLRGKITNVNGLSYTAILSKNNAEINTIEASIGAGSGPLFDPDKMRYGKVVIMTDADVDGSHIQTLLIELFRVYMPGLIEGGKLYIAVPPLYAVSKKGQEIRYAWDSLELERIVKEVGSDAFITRFKGLGEMNADQLASTTMAVETRKLLRVVINDTVSTERLMDILMGDDTEIRRQWINENVDFSLEEEDGISA